MNAIPLNHPIRFQLRQICPAWILLLSQLSLFAMNPVGDDHKRPTILSGDGENRDSLPRLLHSSRLSELALAAQEGAFTYEIDRTGAQITGYNGPGGVVVIPSNLGGQPVTAVGGAAFQGATQAASDSFATKYSDFKAARQTSVDTSAKVKANNLVNKEMMDICDEGQRLFAEDAEMKKLFVFSVVKSLVSPPSSASFKLSVKKTADNTVVAGAAVTIQMAGGVPIVTNTDADGVAMFEKIDPADYNVSVVAPSFVTMNFVKEVNTGTDARKEVFLIVD